MAKSNFPSKIHPEIDPSTYSLEKFKLYETRARFCLIGSDRNKRFFWVLKIDRSEPSDLNVSEDPVVYSPQALKNLLQRIAEGNRATGGLTFVPKVFGIADLKRGVNDRGRVVNDVEIEQIILDEEAGSCKEKMSFVVPIRGSIALSWSQEASRFSPKPDIVLQRYDPEYRATKMHFEDLAKGYGDPIIVLNLIKTVEKSPRA